MCAVPKATYSMAYEGVEAGRRAGVVIAPMSRVNPVLSRADRVVSSVTRVTPRRVPCEKADAEFLWSSGSERKLRYVMGDVKWRWKAAMSSTKSVARESGRYSCVVVDAVDNVGVGDATGAVLGDENRHGGNNLISSRWPRRYRETGPMCGKISDGSQYTYEERGIIVGTGREHGFGGPSEIY